MRLMVNTTFFLKKSVCEIVIESKEKRKKKINELLELFRPKCSLSTTSSSHLTCKKKCKVCMCCDKTKKNPLKKNLLLGCFKSERNHLFFEKSMKTRFKKNKKKKENEKKQKRNKTSCSDLCC